MNTIKGEKTVLKQLILDMGNVLLDYDPEYALSRFCTGDAERDAIRRELFEGPAWIEGDLGLITNEQRYERTCPRIPAAYHPALARCVDRWDECMVPLPGAREFLDRQRERGLGLYVLSNACSRFYRYFPKHYPLSGFSGVVVSSDLRMVKPDVRIYRYLLDRFRLDPTECLFVDDRPENVSAGETAGIPGYRFDGDFDRLDRVILERLAAGEAAE